MTARLALACLTEHPTRDERTRAAIQVADTKALTEAARHTVLCALAGPFPSDEERNAAVEDLTDAVDALYRLESGKDEPEEYGYRGNHGRWYDLCHDRLVAGVDEAAGRLTGGVR